MTVGLGINGFGRMGRLLLRAGWDRPGLSFRHVNEIKGGPEAAAHLLEFDTVRGRWPRHVAAEAEALRIEQSRLGFSAEAAPGEVPWGALGVDVVLECSGRFRRIAELERHLAAGARKVIVAAPVKQAPALDIVVGVNDRRYAPETHDIVSAASCTTNCLAPIVKVLHEDIGIRHGTITTIHSATNSQVIVDAPHKDLRRARSALNALIPTTTGSATAIGVIYPELAGKLDGHAVRVPLLNASLTDCVFELARESTVAEVNGLLRQAAEGALAGILGFEERPLVSSDFLGDPRSAVVDGPSTLVVDGRQAKIYAWYDNEWGYVNRMLDVAGMVAAGLATGTLQRA